MNIYGFLQIVLLLGLLIALSKPVGLYLFKVLEGQPHSLSPIFNPIERVVFKLCGIDASKEHNWKQYLSALLLFNFFGFLVLFTLLKFQHLLPLNPQFAKPMENALAFNTAVSFITNTNWQSYTPETQVSSLVQMVGLTWQNFMSAASGIALALCLIRGITRKSKTETVQRLATLGNFWVDMFRVVLYVLLPLSIIAALFFVSQGMPQTLSNNAMVSTLENPKLFQVISLGPVASQAAIKLIGTNGGGFFSANSAHPFENTTPLCNFIQALLLLLIPASLPYMYGLFAKDKKQGWVLFSAMFILFIGSLTPAVLSESKPNPALRDISQLTHSLGNMEGKEVRFSTTEATIFASATTATSTGAVNNAHDSLTPLAGMTTLVNMQLGEVIFGGVGCGLYGMLIFALLSVFLAGLMVGRTPEYLGKKIEVTEMKWSMVYFLIFPLTVLVALAWAAKGHSVAALHGSTPHGLTEMMVAVTSAAANNGSSFAGLDVSKSPLWWNITLGVLMLIGRYGMMFPIAAIAGSLANKKIVPVGPGTFPTHGPLFALLLIGIILLFGALTFFPVLCLGPIVEHFSSLKGMVL